MAGASRTVRVKVTAGARRERVHSGARGLLEIEVREPAQEHRANGRVIKILADHFGVPERSVRIIAGHTSPRKTVRIVVV